MTTTRRRFTTNDVIIGTDCGIEWGTPIGSVRFSRQSDYIVCEIDDVMAFTVYTVLLTRGCYETAKQINAIIRTKTN